MIRIQFIPFVGALGIFFIADLAIHCGRVRAGPERHTTAPAAERDRGEPLSFRDHDVVAFLGGNWVVQDSETGHLESLLAVSCAGHGVRFRSLGWEADTV